MLIAAGGYGRYVANDAPQHRAPKSAQPAAQQTQPPTQAGHRAPDTTTPEHAKPRSDGDQPHASTRPPGDLTVTSGPHHIDIRKPEYVTLAFDVNLEPGQAITYGRTMEAKTEERLEFEP